MCLADSAGLRRSYRAFNTALGSLYKNDLLELADATDMPDFDDTAFFDAAAMVYNAGSFDASMLNTPEARRLVAETLRQIKRGIDSGLPHEVPEVVRHALENNAFIFSGFKAYHTLREVGLSLVTDKGDIKPFETFRRDVEAVNNCYNHNYLYAEYNHAVGSSLMAARWQKIEADGDRYDLQYRTAQDDRVREEHAVLHGTTLPPSDPFWSLYLPPNGWNCRCTAVQVRKGKYPQSDPALSMLRGNNCTSSAKQQIFRFNPGKDLKLFPPRHPYYKAPDDAKKVVEQMCEEQQREQRKAVVKDLKQWAKDNLPEVQVAKFPSRRLILANDNDKSRVVLNKTFFGECISKYKDDPLYITKLIVAKQVKELFKSARFIGSETSKDHPDSIFKIYETDHNGFRVQFKVKSNADADILYIMRLSKT